jgi:hypothetical protein
MSVGDELKAKALALVSQQMANWVVEIQKQIQQHQANLVASLDGLQETVARYDEKIDEGQIEAELLQVLAQTPPAGPAGPGVERLKASILAIEKGASLSEVLTYLVNEVLQYVDRAVMFIVKGTNVIGWAARGVHPPDAARAISVPLSADTVFRIVQHAKHALRGHISHSPGTAQVLARLGGNPQGVLAIPLILRDKLAAILYCDTSQEEVPPQVADQIEIMVLFASRTIDLLSLAPRAEIGRTLVPRVVTPWPGPAPRPAPAPAPPTPPRAAPHPPSDDGSSTLMWGSGAAAAAAGRTPLPGGGRTVAPPPVAAVSPEDQKAHEDAKRFARLVVSEIKLYNEAKVNEGRRNKDIYERLKEDIERGRQMYAERVNPRVRDSTDYFHDELVRILAGGDASALSAGPDLAAPSDETDYTSLGLRSQEPASEGGYAGLEQCVLLEDEGLDAQPGEEPLPDSPGASTATGVWAPRACREDSRLDVGSTTLSVGPRAPRPTSSEWGRSPGLRCRAGSDPVDVTVFAPPAARPNDSVFVQVFAHLFEQAELARTIAQAFDADAERRGVRSLGVCVPRGRPLAFDLRMPGLVVDDPVQSLIWRGRPESVQFVVTVPGDHPPRTTVGTLTASLDSVPVGHVKFKLQIMAESASPRPTQLVGDEVRRYELVFVSYAAKDRPEVLRRVQMLESLQVPYFQDVLSLDPGDRWERKLYEHIDSCDLFLLFWSKAARASEWVLKEVRYAVARKGGDDLAPPEIKPVLIEGPPPVPPPPDLAHLHFNDRFLYFMQPVRS